MSIGSISSLSSFSIQNINTQSSSQVDVNDLFSSSDEDGSGGLSKTEFASFDASMKEAMSQQGASGQAAPPPPPASSTESSEDLFDKFDLNGDGEVTAAEMKEALESMQSTETSQTQTSDEDTSSMLNELMSQNFQAVMEMMESSTDSSSDENNQSSDQQASIFNQQYSTQIEEYMKQASFGSSASEAVSSLI